TPEHVATVKKSYTGNFLAPILARDLAAGPVNGKIGTRSSGMSVLAMDQALDNQRIDTKAKKRSEERRVGKERRARWSPDDASRRRHTRFSRDWSSDVCSSDLHA